MEKEAITEPEEPVLEIAAVEEPASLMPADEADLTAEPEPVGDEEIAETAKASTDLDFVLAAETPSTAKSAEGRQIRFAEDILPARTAKTKRKKSSKKDMDLPEGKSKPKKGRPRRIAYSEEDEIEE